jgi:hypothetical protein
MVRLHARSRTTKPRPGHQDPWPHPTVLDEKSSAGPNAPCASGADGSCPIFAALLELQMRASYNQCIGNIQAYPSSDTEECEDPAQCVCI